MPTASRDSEVPAEERGPPKVSASVMTAATLTPRRLRPRANDTQRVSQVAVQITSVAPRGSRSVSRESASARCVDPSARNTASVSSTFAS